MPDKTMTDTSTRSPIHRQHATLALAVQYLEVGELRKAEQLCHQVLGADPAQPDAYHLLSLIALQVRQPQMALAHVETAIQLYDQNPEFFCHRGVIYRILGQMEQAIKSYQQALNLDPHYLDAHFNLGNLWLLTNRDQQARDCYLQILERDPAHAWAYCQLGTIADRQGDLWQAENYYRQALHLEPDLAEAHFNLGNLLREQGTDQPTIAHYRAALELKPGYLSAQINLAQILEQQQNWQDAIDLYQQISTQTNTSKAEIWANLAHCYLALEHSDTAQHYLRQATQEDPRQPQYYLAWSQIRVEQGQWQEAIAILQQGVDLNPDQADLVMRAAQILIQNGELGDGLACLEQVIQLQPDRFDAHRLLGSIHHQLNQWDKAEQHLRQAIKLNPQSSRAMEMLGQALSLQERIPEAIGIYKQALYPQPNQVSLHVALGQALLKTGDLAQGFAEMEWRFQGTDLDLSPDQLWDGSDLTGKTILLHNQTQSSIAPVGLGELILYLRFIPELTQRGAQVDIVDPPQYPMKPLLERIPGIAQVLHSLCQDQDYDYHCPIASLAHRLGITWETLPTSVPYLTPTTDPVHQIQLNTNLNPQDLNIGIAWSPNSWDALDSLEGQRRTCPLALFLQLLAIPEVKLWGLSDLSDSDKTSLDPMAGFTDLSPQLHDLPTVAGVLDRLDLVISVDTAYGHLAAALGKSVWLLLPFPCGWIGSQDRSDSPWYPTMSLFRQSQPGDWHGIFRQIAWRVRSQLAAEES